MFQVFLNNQASSILLAAIIGLTSLTMSGCQSRTVNTPTHQTTQTIQAMADFKLAFMPASNNDSLRHADGWSRQDAGRLAIKSFEVPLGLDHPKIVVSLKLKSAGDPWDKSGAVLLMSNNWSEAILADSSKSPGILLDAANGFNPPIELLRFITPFGVGHYSQETGADEYRPVYIPKWEDEVSWQNDVSHLWDSMKDSITLGVFIDTWSAEGFEINLDLEFIEQAKLRNPRPVREVLSLVNTTKLHSEQHPFDGFATRPLDCAFQLSETASNATLHYIATGHGGHSAGDEFVRCEHILALDSDTIAQYTPWRDDCASFRRFNPSSGVWTERTYWRGDSIDERIASSDYSRSGWCPGSDVPALEFKLGNLQAGQHEFTIDIPTAQPYTDSAMNFWNVAAYLTWDGPEER
jgi:hypothetical protein